MASFFFGVLFGFFPQPLHLERKLVKRVLMGGTAEKEVAGGSDLQCFARCGVGVGNHTVYSYPKSLTA